METRHEFGVWARRLLIAFLLCIAQMGGAQWTVGYSGTATIGGTPYAYVRSNEAGKNANGLRITTYTIVDNPGEEPVYQRSPSAAIAASGNRAGPCTGRPTRERAIPADSRRFLAEHGIGGDPGQCALSPPTAPNVRRTGDSPWWISQLIGRA